MVVGAFPLAKLGVLAVQQVNKPINVLIKIRAKKSPFFRNYICKPPAHYYHWMDVNYKMWIMNLDRPANVPKLTEPMAIQLGANVLGEFTILAIASGILIIEYIRSAKRDMKREQAARQEQLEQALTMAELTFRVEKQDAQIREMTRKLAALNVPLTKYRLTDHRKPYEVLPLKNNSETSDQCNSASGVILDALSYLEAEVFRSSA